MGEIQKRARCLTECGSTGAPPHRSASGSLDCRKGITMEYHIEIIGLSPLDAFKLFGQEGSLKSGSAIEIPEVGRIVYQRMIERRTLGAEAVVELLLELGAAVGTGVAANFIYDKLKRKNSRIRVDRTEIEFEKGEIKRILSEKFEKKG